MFAAQSRARVINTRMALATAQKGTSTVVEWFARMKALADEMASAGKMLDDEEIASYILADLDIDFNPLVSAIAARVEPLTLGKLFTQMTSFEERMDLLHGLGSSTNMASRGGGRGGGNGGRGRGRGRGGFNSPGGCGRGRSGGRGSSFEAGVFCQICSKEGHPAVRCFKCFDTNFTYAQEKNKSASTATTSYGLDTNWYVDIGATDHITSELEKNTVRDKYHGNDQVHTASGSGMKISHVDRSLFHTHDCNLILDKVLLVPQSQ